MSLWNGMLEFLVVNLASLDFVRIIHGLVTIATEFIYV